MYVRERGLAGGGAGPPHAPLRHALEVISGREYLYEISDRFGNGRSLGPRSAVNEKRLDGYRKARADVDQRSRIAWDRVEQNARIGRALRLPAIAEPAGRILREFDLRGMLAPYLLVAEGRAPGTGHPGRLCARRAAAPSAHAVVRRVAARAAGAALRALGERPRFRREGALSAVNPAHAVRHDDPHVGRLPYLVFRLTGLGCSGWRGC